MRRFLIISGAFATAMLAAMPVQAQSRAKGVVPLSQAAYEALPAMPRYRAFLPPVADLSAWFPKPGSQGGQPSCVAWASAYALRSYFENRFAAPGTTAPTPMSPAFVYNLLAKRERGCDSGFPIPVALDLLKHKGVPPLAQFAYSDQGCQLLPSTDIERSATRFRIRDFRRLDKDKLDDIKGQIAGGTPVLVAMNVSKEFEAFTGSVAFDTDGPVSGVHAMVAVGYDDVRQAFRLINSWGQDWGDHGFAWVSYRIMAATLLEAYAVEVERPVVTDEPPPPPKIEPDPPPKPEPVVVVPPPQPQPQPKPEPAVQPPPPKPHPAPQPPPPGKPLAEARQALDRAAAALQCAGVRVRAGDGLLAVDGFVATALDRDRLAKILGDGGPGWRPRLEVAVEPWPHCETRLTLAGPLAQPRGLTVIAPVGTVLRDNDDLAIEVTAPDFPSHIDVSYVQADGQVVHLRDGGDLVKPGTRLKLSGKIAGPVYGREMVVVVASRLPLRALDRPGSETERDYLTGLRLALNDPNRAKAGSTVAAAILPITTAPTQGGK